MRRWLNLFGPLNQTGMGTHFYHWAREMVTQLTQKGVNVCVIPRGRIGRPELADGRTIEGLDAALAGAIELQKQMLFDTASICLWHGNDMSQFCGKPRIGYTVWETSELSLAEQNHLGQLDLIAVPSAWHRKVLQEKHNFDPEYVLVWPEGYDPAVFSPTQPYGPLASTAFTFVNVGKWEMRKGTPVLASAFGKLASEHQMPMRLLGAWGNPWMGTAWLPEVSRALMRAGFEKPTILQSPGLPGVAYGCVHKTNPQAQVVFFDFLTKTEDVRMLYACSNAGVYPYFAEGWCLPLLETMAMQKPVVATPYGAPLEYLVAAEYVPIKGGTAAQAFDGLFFHGDRGTWHQVDRDAVCEAMSELLLMPSAEREDMAAKGRKDVAQFTWANAATATIDSLFEIGVLRS